MSNLVLRFATVSGQGLHWWLKRNCSVTPGQLMWVYASLCLLSALIAGFFWRMGARLVMPFAGFELVAVGAAFLVYARHATDGESIELTDARLVIERETAGRRERAEFRREWVRVEPAVGDRSLIRVSAQGRSVEVGRFVRPELRSALATEIRRALRAI